MSATNQTRRAGATAVLALLFMVGCRDSASERMTGLTPGGPSFAAGGSVGVNLDQCANNVPRGGDCTWQNGDLNGNNSQYAEGLAIPFRLTIDGLNAGTQYQIHLNYDWTAGGHKAYDFLASDNATEQVNVCAAGGGGVPSACSNLGSPFELGFGGDDFPHSIGSSLSVTDAIAFAASAQGGGFVASGERKLRLYRGTIDAISLPTHTDNQGNPITSLSDLSGNTEADILVTFTPTSSSVLFTWSAHLAQSAYWDGAGTPNGANQISGAPWHMRTQGLQTSGGTSAGNKNQDRSIQPSAIIQPPVMDISKTADATTVNAGTTIGFTITVHNTGSGPADGFALSDPLPGGPGISWTIASQSGPVTCAIASNTLNCPSSGTASFPAGGTLTVHITSPTTGASCGFYGNTATVSLSNGVAPAPATAQITVNCPSLSLTKTADAASVNAGSTIGFTITVNNAGQGAASGFALSDPLPTGSGISWSIASQSGPVTCVISSNTLNCPSSGTASFAAGGTLTVHITSPTTAASCATYSNTATVSLTNGTAPSPATAQTTVNCPSLSLTKTADAASVNAGSTIGFTITVSNSGQGAATGFSLSDPLPTGSGISWSIASQSGPVTCVISGNSLNCPSSGSTTLAAGATLTVHITSPTTAASCATYTNTATVSLSNGTAPSPETAHTTVNCPSLSLTKTADAASVNAGSTIGFTITVNNAGQGAATGFALSDPLPTGSGISWSIASQSGPVTCAISSNTLNCPSSNTASFPAGGTLTVHITSPTTAASCATYSNTATVSLTNGTAPSPATAQTTVNCPSLSLTKTADAATVSAGAAIGFTVTVSNAGQGTATGFALSDPLPTGTGISWSIASQSGPVTCVISSNTLNCPFSGTTSFPAGGTLTVHITSPTTAASCATYSNTATVSMTNGTAPAPATAQTTVQCPSLSITKTADAATVSAGTAIGFTITVSNAGPGTATSVTLTDALPTGTGIVWSISPAVSGCSISSNTLSCNFGDLAAGGSKTVHVTSPTTGQSCKTYPNTATAQATNNAQVTANASTTVNCGEIQLTKTADAATVNAGESIGFTITASNSGAGDLTSVVVTDQLPTQSGLSWSISPAVAGCSISSGTLTCNFGTLASGASASVHITSPTTFASCATISNQASVATGNDGSGNASANVTVQCPSLHITKTADAATVSAGSSIGFTIGVSNSGPGTAKSVTLSDALPTGSGVSWSISPAVSGCSISSNTLTCNLGDMASGGSVSVHVTSSTAFASCKQYSNTASASATNHAQVQASASTTVQCPNLTITKTPDPNGTGYTLHPGGTATFTITVSNTGPGAATNVVITDTLPVAPTAPWTDNKAECGVTQITVNSVTRDLLTCNVGTLAANASFTVQVSSTIPATYLFQDPSPAGTPIEIDGNLTDDPDLGKDWATLGISCTGTIVGCDLDLPTGSNDNSFGQGTKEDTPIPSVVFGSIPNNKSDLLRFYVSKERFGTTDFLYLAWERVQAPKGTTNMDFELNQSSVLSSNGVTPVRTAGDLLIKFDLSSGGTNPVLGYHKWVDAAHAGGQSASAACEASNSFPCWGKVISLAGSATVAAKINTDTVPDPINPNATRYLDPLTFGEARIDLEGSGIFQTGVCVNFGRAYLKSRSSDSFSAEIKDFIAPIPVTVSNCQTKFLHNTAWAKADNFSPANGVSDTGDIQVTETQSASASVLAPTTRLATGAGSATTMNHGTGSATTMNPAVVSVPVAQSADLRPVVSTGDKPIHTFGGLPMGPNQDFDRRLAAKGSTALSEFMT